MEFALFLITTIIQLDDGKYPGRKGMCGAYYLLKSPRLRERMGIESLDELKQTILDSRRQSVDPYLPLFDQRQLHLFRPTNSIPFFHLNENAIQWQLAHYWWLVLENDGNSSLKPATKWASFNSRFDKFLAPKGQVTMHRIKPESFRVVIPGDGFIEWQPETSSPTKEKRPLSIRPANHDNSLWPTFFAGVAKAYEVNGETIYSCSLVTLPGHDKLTHIHKKSIPLMLSIEDIEEWCNPDLTWAKLKKFAKPKLSNDLVVESIDLENGKLVEFEEIIPKDKVA